MIKFEFTLRDCCLERTPTSPATASGRRVAQPDDGRCLVPHTEAQTLLVKPCLPVCRWCSDPEHHGSINVWLWSYLLVVVYGVGRLACWTTGLPDWTLPAAVSMSANAHEKVERKRSVRLRRLLETGTVLNAARYFSTVASKSFYTNTF